MQLAMKSVLDLGGRSALVELVHQWVRHAVVFVLCLGNAGNGNRIPREEASAQFNSEGTDPVPVLAVGRTPCLPLPRRSATDVIHEALQGWPISAVRQPRRRTTSTSPAPP
jgi:hypothetical protein